VLFIGGENVASNYPCHSQTILRIFWVHNRGRIQNRRLTRWDGGALAPTVSAIKLITGSVLSGLNGFLLLPGHTHPRQRLPAESEHFPLWQDHPYKAHISSILFFLHLRLPFSQPRQECSVGKHTRRTGYRRCPGPPNGRILGRILAGG
jgi:hypothetical protein